MPEDDPYRLLAEWLRDAAATELVNWEAMALATAGNRGRPSVRMVLLRGHDERGLVFYTSRESAKGRELATNPWAALVLHWQPLERQVRVEGAVEPVSEDESAAYFATRPRGSQLAAWASEQSRELPARAELERRFAEAEERFAGGDVPLPPFWGGYRVVPDSYEFWEGRANRLHHRVRYERDGDGWRRFLLNP